MEEEQFYRHNDNINYLLQRRLSFILRYGMTFLFVIGMLVLGSMYFVKVPDTLEGRFNLTSNNPPKSLIVKTSGRVILKRMSDKAMVKKGDLLIILESVANPDEINKLEVYLKEIGELLRKSDLENIKPMRAGVFEQLGEIQQVYEQYKKSTNELCLALAAGQYKQEKEIIAKRLANLELNAINLQKQKTILDREYTMSDEGWKTDSLLMLQHSITQSELRNSESLRLQRKLSLNNLQQNIINNETAKNDVSQQLLILEKNVAQQKNTFIQGYSLLKTALADWKSKYMLIAPLDGVATYNRNVYEGLQVEQGEALVYIVPTNSKWIAELLIRQQNFGKLHPGQRAVLKLDSYQFEEFGVIEGRVLNVSAIPLEIKTNDGVQNMFTVQILLDSLIKTNYSNQIVPHYGLSGTANIVLDDKSLLNKLFLDRFRSLFNYQ